MKPQILRIATRESPLALWQANHIRNQLLQHWPDLEVELLPMSTTGDQFLKDRVLKIGGKGVFVKELEDALLNKRADIAVHSMKDVPSTFPEGLCLTAIGTRHDPFDAFVSNHYERLEALPPAAIVGTSSLRRQSQLLAIRPDLQIKPLRGNINTRISKLDAEFDAIILAIAGLERLDMQHLIKQRLPEGVMLPACGQGALGIECREEDERIKKLIEPLNDPISALCVQTERRVNAELGGNCHTPIAIYCVPTEDSQLILHTKIASVDGQIVLSNSQRGAKKDAMLLAEVCARTLLADGAAELLAQIEKS